MQQQEQKETPRERALALVATLKAKGVKVAARPRQVDVFEEARSGFDVTINGAVVAAAGWSDVVLILSGAAALAG